MRAFGLGHAQGKAALLDRELPKRYLTGSSSRASWPRDQQVVVDGHPLFEG